ncbi:uncharacterized protein HMPREF1541_01316 [Cyphellophora europaea CBS 101466]|uniref:Endoplasmic reticulum junction formation protein lunapark n=1 Tax=Cyphellophora europaea (strain CBS 101466) TaxID=1220924 RepID=W2SEG4_CYPE1|nr:uncharacterized protein HMPREF1541_01316 [Cyphellophora europaea CBS 101466]ETN47126.1 hypothetical protein HMPREF1541_01316 [Cyphellophora europaea CBS 101466]
MSWLWRNDASSPASFEKALQKLSSQITAANLSVDTTRSRARRVKALWTLWTTITFLLYALIITLVLGPHNWSLPHYSGLVGAPVAIYGVRKILSIFFDWRINRQQSHLEALQKQRESKIADLKKATKYDSTQELLQKYGGGPPKEQTPSKKGGKAKDGPQRSPQQQQPQQHQRTGLPPPPTANIPGRHLQQNRPNIQPPPTANIPSNRPQPNSPGLTQSPAAFSPDAPGFAPNAFPLPPPTAPPAYVQQQGPHWYDRILDVMLGEDETAAKNRLALICNSCRLVNGQAPPGVRTLEESGRWRCGGCGAWNGVDERGKAREAVEDVRREVMGAGDPVAEAEENGWEEIVRAQDEGADVAMQGTEGTTGREGGDESRVVTKRVTRSMVADEDS